ncbi:MAG: DUF4383 domain-containing protein [Alphaproteobacteria bacterium]
MNARTAALVFGAVFILVGVLGFIPNPLVGPEGLFVTNVSHDLVHIVSGAVLLAGVYTQLGASLALKIIGIAYAIVAVLGFVMPGDMMLGMIAMNEADRWLHVLLAIVLLAAGFGLKNGMKKA